VAKTRTHRKPQPRRSAGNTTETDHIERGWTVEARLSHEFELLSLKLFWQIYSRRWVTSPFAAMQVTLGERQPFGESSATV
jgi:hypothetical protein